ESIRTRTAEAERQFHEEITAARTEHVMAGVAAAIARVQAAGPAPVAPVGPAAAPMPAAELAESWRRVLGRLDSAVPSATAARFERRAADALAVPSAATARRLLDDLRYTIDRANAEVAQRRARLAELGRRLAHHAGTAVDEARIRIAAAADDPDPDLPGLERLVDDAVVAAEHAAAEAFAAAVPAMRDYATRALRESLEEIGCAVEPDFEVTLVRDGMAHVQRPGWEDLAVRVRTNPRDNTMSFNLVTPRDGTASDLATVEQQWCGAVDDLLPALADRGVEVAVTRRSEEGTAEAQQVDPARYPFSRSRRARRYADQQRE